MDIMELAPLKGPSDNSNVEHGEQAEETTRNGLHGSGANEDNSLLQQDHESNGERYAMPAVTEESEKKPAVLKRLKAELNTKVAGEIRLWMAILMVLIIIVLVILLFLFLCSGHQEDVDDKYDTSTFVVPLFFRGTFTVANQSFVQDQMTPSHQEYSLFESLRKKITDIYRSSPSLERYFFHATIHTLSHKNGSVQYDLEFRMPVEHEQLKRYILSKEMVNKVLLQQLLDQDTEDPLYIVPSSLITEDGKWN